MESSAKLVAGLVARIKHFENQIEWTEKSIRDYSTEFANLVAETTVADKLADTKETAWNVGGAVERQLIQLNYVAESVAKERKKLGELYTDKLMLETVLEESGFGSRIPVR